MGHTGTIFSHIGAGILAKLVLVRLCTLVSLRRGRAFEISATAERALGSDSVASTSSSAAAVLRAPAAQARRDRSAYRARQGQRARAAMDIRNFFAKKPAKAPAAAPPPATQKPKAPAAAPKVSPEAAAPQARVAEPVSSESAARRQVAAEGQEPAEGQVAGQGRDERPLRREAEEAQGRRRPPPTRKAILIPMWRWALPFHRRLKKTTEEEEDGGCRDAAASLAGKKRSPRS